MASEAAAVSHTGRAVDPMEQVRDLLFGEAKRGHDQRFEMMQAHIDALAQRLDQRLDGLQKDLNALQVSGRHEQDTTISAVGEALAEVGRKIAALKAHGG